MMFAREPHRLFKAFWANRHDGFFGLSRDWEGKVPPPVTILGGWKIRLLRRVPPRLWARFTGYFFEKGKPVFFLWPKIYPNYEWHDDPPRVAGSFNHWKPDERWEMRLEHWRGEPVWVLRAEPAEGWIGPIGSEFKFVTRGGNWLEVPHLAFNRRRDLKGNYNYFLNPEQTGRHIYHFVVEEPVKLGSHLSLVWNDERSPHALPIFDWDFLLERFTLERPGCEMRKGGGVVFRVFSPRAEKVLLETWPAESDSVPAARMRVEMKVDVEGMWAVEVPEAAAGWRYQFFISGENYDNSLAFDDSVPVLDPYALAALGREGPGLVVDLQKEQLVARRFSPPPVTDLVILEAHVRDLVARLPGSGKRPGFRELAAWIRSPDCYLRRLGVNALELQPIQEFDAAHPEDYHWGYMTNNFFAPASAYSRNPAAGTQLEDFRDMVEACHEAGLAVILDVVYNHVGEPNHLLRIDKTYYLEVDQEDRLTNWSGCGNDLRTTTPMGRRLVLDSLRHLVEFFDVDGFRFDLAELVGLPLLQEAEKMLREIKPGIVLIAEPWSFRGNIVQGLLRTSYASWNDEFREYLPAYVHGARGSDGLCHFLGGSLKNALARPAHTVNYSESHDDMGWLDRITENPGNKGTEPTENDVRRTRLMAALVLSALGVPMLAEGQDFLRSKGGRRNTYLQGEVNALDYERLERFQDTHAYFRAWIAFRLSPAGAAFRLAERPAEGYFRFFPQKHSNALAVWYNADGKAPVPPVFLAVNPHPYPVTLWLPGVDAGGFRQVANGERFCENGLLVEKYDWSGGELKLPPLATGLWVVRG